jgi:hypothetical protein
MSLTADFMGLTPSHRIHREFPMHIGATLAAARVSVFAALRRLQQPEMGAAA